MVEYPARSLESLLYSIDVAHLRDMLCKFIQRNYVPSLIAVVVDGLSEDGDDSTSNCGACSCKNIASWSSNKSRKSLDAIANMFRLQLMLSSLMQLLI